jgi:hypothetical protein
MVSQIAHTGPKRSPPPPQAAHAPTGRIIIIMSASHSFHIFHKLELIKREKLNKLSISKN